MVDAVPVLPPEEAIAFFRRKGFAIGFSWLDIWQEEHVRAFTVAKAMSRDLLEEIRAAVDQSIAEGETLDMFRKNLRPKLEARGWWGRRSMVDPATGEQKIVQLGSPRRLKTIFNTNMRTAYAAGRWERAQRVKKAFPLGRYVSVMDGRERPQHHAWHGTIKPVDDPWWDTHYPPCGWSCRCTFQSLNQRMLDRQGWSVTEEPPSFPLEDYTNKRTGEVTKIEEGIDPGFSYNVGKAYLDGLAPGPLPRSFDGTETAASADNPIDAFLAAFDTDRRGKIFTDKGGWPLAISAGWFRAPGGELAVPSWMRGRTAAIAGILIEPREIRWVWVRDRVGNAMLMRRYLGRAGKSEMVVDVGRLGWRARVAHWRSASPRGGTLAWSAGA